jgi:YD repeat-containing protein
VAALSEGYAGQRFRFISPACHFAGDAGLLTSETNPENGAAMYTYNSNNTLNTKTDAKGAGFRLYLSMIVSTEKLIRV